MKFTIETDAEASFLRTLVQAAGDERHNLRRLATDPIFSPWIGTKLDELDTAIKWGALALDVLAKDPTPKYNGPSGTTDGGGCMADAFC